MREYVLRLIEADLGRTDTTAEMLDRLRQLPKATGADAVGTLHEGRRRREAELSNRHERD